MSFRPIPNALNHKHQLMIEHYVKYGNARAAYQHAYPTAAYSTAKSDGSRLMNSPLFKEEIQRQREEIAIAEHVSKTDVVRELTTVAEEARLAGKYDAYAKMKDMVIKMFGFYEPDKIQHQGDVGIQIIKLTEVKRNEIDEHYIETDYEDNEETNFEDN